MTDGNDSVTEKTVSQTSRDFEQTQVADSAKKGFWSMFVIMLGFTFFSASMLTGAKLGAGSTFKGFILAVLAGNLILGVYTSLLAYMASSTGLSVHLLARRSFGLRGSGLPSFLLAITQIGWFGVGVAMFAVPVQLWLKSKNVDCNLWIPILLSGALMTSSAYWGIKALAVVSVVAVPLIAVGGGFSSIKVFVDNPDAWNKIISYIPESGMTFSAAVALTVGSFISGGTCTPDFVRFAKNRKIAVSTTAIAFFIGNSLMFLFGAIGAIFFNVSDISDVLVLQGLLVPGILVLGLNIWTTNDNALYTSGLGFSNITGFPKKYVVLFNGAVGTIFAKMLYDNFCGYLNILNTCLPSIGAVLMADFFVVRKLGWVKGENTPLHGIPAIAAWFVGVCVANFIPCGITSINGIAAAFAVYVIFVKIAVSRGK